MRINKADQQPKRVRTLAQVKRQFATKNDARWRGVPCRTADSAASYMRIGH